MATQIRKILEDAKERLNMTDEQYRLVIVSIMDVFTAHATTSDDHDELIIMIKEVYGEI